MAAPGALHPALSGAPRRVYFVSLGCSKNQVDSEAMLGMVHRDGHTLVDNAQDADVLVVNTCGFIQAAKEESIDAILELGAVKAAAAAERGLAPQLVVTGCLSQRYGSQLADELPEVDVFLGSSDAPAFAQLLQTPIPRMSVSDLGRRSWLYDHTVPRTITGTPHSVVVKIAEGCDRPCAFCIIPTLRGPQRSRSVQDIVAESRELVAAGAREIRLVAQDLTKYGDDLQGASRRGSAGLETLIDALGEIDGLRWIRLHYAYPSAVSDRLIEQIATHPKVATYLDVPFQHTDTQVLKQMRRGYTERTIHELVERIRAASPRIWLRTTLLVGHPGETQAAYERLRDFVAQGEIDFLGVFPWSSEDGTAAAELEDLVDPQIADERASELMAIQASLRLGKHKELLGKTMEVVIDGPSEESEMLLDARHEGQAPEVDGKVIVCDGTAARGAFAQVRIIQVGPHDLIGSFDLEREPDPEILDDDEDGARVDLWQ